MILHQINDRCYSYRVAVVAYGSTAEVITVFNASTDIDAVITSVASSIPARSGPPAIGAALGVTSADVFEGPASQIAVAKHAVVIHQSDTSETAFLFDRRRYRLVAGNSPGVTVHAIGPVATRIATTSTEVCHSLLCAVLNTCLFFVVGVVNACLPFVVRLCLTCPRRV